MDELQCYIDICGIYLKTAREIKDDIKMASAARTLEKLIAEGKFIIERWDYL